MFITNHDGKQVRVFVWDDGSISIDPQSIFCVNSMTIQELATLGHTNRRDWDEDGRPYLLAYHTPRNQFRFLSDECTSRKIYLDTTTISDRNNILINDYLDPENMHDAIVTVTYSAIFKAPDKEYAKCFMKARFADWRGVSEDPDTVQVEMQI